MEEFKNPYEDLQNIMDAVAKDLAVDDLNADEKAARLPMVKHYWVGKLIQSKVELKRREAERAELIKTLEDYGKSSEIALTKDSIRKKLMASPKMRELNARIDELNFIIEFLGDAKFILGRATDDMKNFIELKKLEQL